MEIEKFQRNRSKIAGTAVCLTVIFAFLSGIYFSGSGLDVEIEVVNMSGEDKADELWLKFDNREGEEVRGVVRTVHKHSSSYGAWKEKSSGGYLISLKKGENLFRFEPENRFSKIPNKTWFKVTFSPPDEKWWISSPRMNSEDYMN